MNFYVYEHWRPDLDLPFYVGKGKGNRANDMRKRNVGHKAITAALSLLGLCVEVRVVRGDLPEVDAIRIEAERIAFWRKSGVHLENQTIGGAGISNPTPELRARLGAISKARVRTPEWCKNISLGVSNQSVETRQKRSNTMRGIVRSAETKARVSAAKKNPSEDIRLKNREAARRSWSDPAYREKWLSTRRANLKLKETTG